MRVEPLLRLLIWTTIALVALVDVIGMRIKGLSLTVDSILLGSFALFIVDMLLFFFVRSRSSYEAVTNGFEGIMQLMAFEFVFLLLSYVASGRPLPYYDEAIWHIDRSLGFAWENYAAWVNMHSVIAVVYMYAYMSISIQMSSAIVVLSLIRQCDRMYRLLLAVILSSIYCIVVAFYIPTIGIHGYLHLNEATVPLGIGYVHIGDVVGLRQGTLREWSLSQFKGLITFPSFHTSLAVLLGWAFWTVRWLRWPFLFLNAMVVASVPIIGGHYLLDVIGGAVIAVAMILVVKYIIVAVSEPIRQHSPISLHP